MPIFQDEDDMAGHGRATKNMSTLPPDSDIPERDISVRRASDESIRTDLCEGLLLESPEKELEGMKSEASHRTSDRGEFMERLKRGESPTWVPNRSIESLFQKCKESPTNSQSLLPSAEFQQSRKSSNAETENSHVSSEIERPRSALHSGDFTQERKGEKEVAGEGRETIDKSYIPTPTPWMATSPPRDFTPFQLDSRFPRASRPPNNYERHSQVPSVSSSLSSSFVLKAPTSPLVQFESNEDVEYDSLLDAIDLGVGSHNLPRRHTLQASHSISSTPNIPPVFNFSRPLPNLRRDNIFPYQAHQPRRSLASSSSFQDDIGVPTSPPFLRSRRTSYTFESSPLQLASMVGSYEESILRGRMSTTPSKPLDFVAKIGVLGKGKCKPYLRCPAHVTLPFPAVFYSYGTTSHGRMANSEDGPSPYVGQIDLENGIVPKERTRKRKPKTEIGEPDDLDLLNDANDEVGRSKPKEASLRAPPGGCYRIPEKGQLQIIIKNPNNTAIKLFLVPYDLAGMVSGTKTFIRQRIYSAGPIIDAPVSALPSPKALPPSERPILRYLIHIHICCPSKNRFYLYKSIRVVFANRVPDGKETLKSEIQLPEPRFSPWKPARESVGPFVSAVGVGAGAMLAADKAFRRRSAGFPLSNLTNAGVLSKAILDSANNVLPTGGHSMSTRHISEGANSSSFSYNFEQPLPFTRETPIKPIPFSFERKQIANIIPATSNSRFSSEHSVASGENDSNSDTSSKFGDALSDRDGLGGDREFNGRLGMRRTSYDKLRKGDVGYGGGSIGRKSSEEGLLARKLKGLRIDGMTKSSEGSDE